MGEDTPPQTGETLAAQERRVPVEEAGLRLDRWFRRHFPDLPHSALERFLRRGDIRVDRRRAKASTRLSSGAVVRIPSFSRREAAAPATRPLHLTAKETKDLQARVLYFDADILLLNKPPGLAVQGGSGLFRHLGAMLHALQFDAPAPPQLTHRLDKETGGLLILARHPAAAAFIAAAFRAREIEKVYLALVCGKPNPPRGEIASPAGKKLLPARTLYQTLRRKGKFAYVRFSPITGRTHQIRSHAAAAGFPVAGDRVYGIRRPLPQSFGKGLCLHARQLVFPHPAGGRLQITAPLPEHMAQSLTAISMGGNQIHEQR